MKPRRGPINLLSLIAWVIFIVAAVGAGASFLYQSYLNGRISSDEQSLNLTKGEFDPATINQIIHLDTRLNVAGTLLSGHSALSNVFAALESTTKQTVRFTSFTFSTGNQNLLTLVMNGEAQSFSDVSLQSTAFNQTSYFKNLVVSALSVEQNGLVSFTMTMTVDPSLIVYAPPAGTSAATSSSTPLNSLSAPATPALSATTSATSSKTTHP